jgi:hypothetical protein
MPTALFISKEDLIKQTPLSANIDFDKVLHFIKIAQDIHIHQILGSKLYEKLQSDILGSSLTGDYETLVETHIKPTLVQFSFMEYLPFSQYTISNKGVFKSTSENSALPSPQELDAMRDAARDTAQYYAKRLVEFLRHNDNLFPEYKTNTDEDLRPAKDITFGGWHI